MSAIPGGHIRQAKFPRMKNRSYQENMQNQSIRKQWKLTKAIYQKKIETDKSKEKPTVLKAESAGKAVSAKTCNFGQGRAQFIF